MTNDQCLAKGFYQHTQIKDFISVQQYMIVRARGKKCLLLRLLNDADFEAAYIRFTLRQFNAAGDQIAQTPVRINNLRLKPGATLTTDGGIVLREECADFKIVWDEVGSGRYRYYARDGHVVVRYVPEDVFIAPVQASPAKKEKRRGGKSSVTAVAVMLALMLLINILNLVSLYNRGVRQQEEEARRNEQIEESTNQRNELQNNIDINKGQYQR
jgi:hypothetical protein